MKKSLSVFMATLLLISALMVSAGAENVDQKISVHLKSDISGLTYEDCDQLAVDLSDNIVFDDDPILISDHAGNLCFDKLKAGRTYTIYYRFIMKDGYDFPNMLDDETVQIECDPGCTVYWYGKTTGNDGHGNPEYSITLFAEIQVKGTFFERLFGKIADFFLKLSAWSPY